MSDERFRGYLEEELPEDLGYYLDCLELPYEDRRLCFELFSKIAPIGLRNPVLSIGTIMYKVGPETLVQRWKDENWLASMEKVATFLSAQLFKNQLAVKEDESSFVFKDDIATLGKTYKFLAILGQSCDAPEAKVERYLNIAQTYLVRASL